MARVKITRSALLADGIMPCRCAPGLGSWATFLCHLLFFHFCFMSLYGVQQQQYADDTQLYIALSPSDPRNELNALHTCLTSLQKWFYTNGMALNPDKSSAILLGTAQRASAYSSLTSADVTGTPVQLVNSKLLGVTLDTNLTMWENTRHVSQSCFTISVHFTKYVLS